MYLFCVKSRSTFRFYPTERQQRQLAREFGCARHAYNFSLRLRTDSFKQGKSVNYVASSGAWTKHRQDPAFSFLRESSCTPQQQALRHLQTAFSNFFAKRSKYPRFRSKHGKQSAEYTVNAFKWDAVNRNLTISKVGRLQVQWSRKFTSNPTTVTITKRCDGKYFVTLCLDEAKHALPKTGRQVGVDLGISRLATLSTGEFVPNARHTAKHAVKLAKLQRVLSRRVKRSNRWRAQKIKVARHQAHIADSRKDTLDKLTMRLVREFDVIAIEDLNVRGMVKLPTLAKAISCASFGTFRAMLEYKAGWYGKEVRVADRFFPSSKRCFSCGHIHPGPGLEVREFDCENCGEHLDRDLNASRNILKFARASGPTTAGQAGSNAQGERVSRGKASASPRIARRTVNQPSSANV